MYSFSLTSYHILLLKKYNNLKFSLAHLNRTDFCADSTSPGQKNRVLSLCSDCLDNNFVFVFVFQYTEKPHVVETIDSKSTSHYITLMWVAPFDGNKPILRYNITYKDLTIPGFQPITVSTKELKINLTDKIFPDRNYSAFIIAENEIGPSDKSMEITLTTKESGIEFIYLFLCLLFTQPP